jgi:UDP-3-O-[3-hydroxymyristoyl] N-acetylglucosamine deacetylase
LHIKYHKNKTGVLRVKSIYQKTINREVEIKGIGIHSGQFSKIKLIPAEENTGIVFVKNSVKIPAKLEFAKSFDFSTTLVKENEKIQTVEHLLAALYLLEIDNIYIEIEGNEIPILDGSAKIFIEKIKEAGVKTQGKEKEFAVINREITFSVEDKYIHAVPSDTAIFTYKAIYNNFIGNRSFSFNTYYDDIENISGARTYCFFEEVEKLKELGLAKGGSLENAVVFKDDNVLNPEGLRFEDEPVRHKLLDLIGDLYLLGRPIIGEITSVKGGHSLNAAFLNYAIKENLLDFVPASKIACLSKAV